MSKTVSTCICETNLIANQPQENVFFLTLSRTKADFPGEFLRTARSTSPIQICAVFSTIGPDNEAAMLNIELNRELEKMVSALYRSSVLDFEAFSNQVINVLNVKVCNISATWGIPLKTSMTMIVIEGDVLRVIHVGNTKATLFRDNRLMVLTEEQTVAHRYVQMGSITPEQEMSHPDNMNLTQYLGKMPQDGPVVPFKKVQLKLHDNDEIFIMGLGISHLMPSQMRNLILVRPVGPESKARELMGSAMNYGIKSGLTAICMKVESVFLLPGDAVIGSHLASDGTVSYPKAAQKDSDYVSFGEPQGRQQPAAREDYGYDSNDVSNTRPFNRNEVEPYGDEEEDDEYDDYDDFSEDKSFDKKERNKRIVAIVIPIVIFMISVLLGFGIMYLIFNLGDLIKGSESTTTTTASNLVYYVTEDGTPVFALEDINSGLVASLNRGDAVTVNSAGGSFSFITTSDNVSGYIMNDKISLEDPTFGEESSIMETDPTPLSTESETESSDTSVTSSDTIATTEMVPQTQQTQQTTKQTTAATTPKPVETTPQPVETTPQPIETTPQPVETTPQPVETTPQPQPQPQPEEGE
ncbi:Serine/threonine protein phosphatase PrpC [Ruminococcaceae bacterium YRB3002]|nr:Serine/threonine protein phosphatase PrpC [Ruminococcaceae bacterium YRB3002]